MGCAYACFPVPNTTISLGLWRLTMRREDASAVRKAVSSSAFTKPVGRPSLSINVREPRGVGSLSSRLLMRGSANVGAPRVTTACNESMILQSILVRPIPFIPIPEELVDGINNVVVPFFLSNCCRSGCWKLHPSLSLLALVEYSCRASRRVFCNFSTSSLVRW